MNMEYYQLFMKVLAFVQHDKSSEPIHKYMHYDKSKFYGMIGAKTSEEMAKAEEKRTEFMFGNINYGLKQAHYFEIDKIEKRLLILTDAPRDKRIIKQIESV